VKHLRPLRVRRATIKAHPATPHRSSPYGNGISPEGMESPCEASLFVVVLHDTLLQNKTNLF
jgi:hypothetical protein